MPRFHQFIISMLLTVTAVGLGWGIYSASRPAEEPTLSGPPPDQPPVEPDESDQAPAVQIIPPPLTDFSEMVARPLFSQSRSPEDPNAGPTTDPLPTQPTGKSRLVVMGIIITEGEKIALLKQGNQKEGDTLKVKEGQEVSGWKIASITTESVTVSQRDTTDVIKLSDNVLSEAEKRRLAALAKASKLGRKRTAPQKAAPNTAAAKRSANKRNVRGRMRQENKANTGQQTTTK